MITRRLSEEQPHSLRRRLGGAAHAAGISVARSGVLAVDAVFGLREVHGIPTMASCPLQILGIAQIQRLPRRIFDFPSRATHEDTPVGRLAAGRRVLVRQVCLIAPHGERMLVGAPLQISLLDLEPFDELSGMVNCHDSTREISDRLGHRSVAEMFRQRGELVHVDTSGVARVGRFEVDAGMHELAQLCSLN